MSRSCKGPWEFTFYPIVKVNPQLFTASLVSLTLHSQTFCNIHPGTPAWSSHSWPGGWDQSSQHHPPPDNKWFFWYMVFFSLVPPQTVPSSKKLILARLGVSRPIYVNVDSPNLGFPYLDFLGGYRWKKKHPVCQHPHIMQTSQDS